MTIAHLATLSMHLIDCFDRVQMVDARIKTNLVHYNDARSLGFLIKFTHCRGYITGCDDVNFSLYRSLYDSRVVRVRDQRDDEIMCSNLSLEIIGIIDVQRNALCIWKTLCKRLCTLERAACCRRNEDR